MLRRRSGLGKSSLLSKLALYQGEPVTEHFIGPTSARFGEGGAGRTPRIIIVEPDAVVREALQLLFETQSIYSVIAATGQGRIAVDLAHTLEPDLVTFELGMPDVDLFDWLRLMRSRAVTPLVAITEHPEPELARHLLTVGVSAYLLKHSCFRAVRRGVDLAHQGTPTIDPALQRAPDRLSRAPSARELTVLRLSASGATTKEIAQGLGIAAKTVAVHKANAMRKYRLTSRAELIRFACARGWL